MCAVRLLMYCPTNTSACPCLFAENQESKQFCDRRENVFKRLKINLFGLKVNILKMKTL